MSKHPKINILPDDDYHWDLSRAGDIEARNYIVEYHMQLVIQIVHSLMRKLPHSVEKDDLIGYGAFGLIKAAETYDPSKGKFTTHAAFRINNSIYDGLRKEDWAPKSLRRNLKDIEQARSQLFDAWNREPTNEEIGDYMDKDAEWVTKLRKIEDTARPVFLSNNGTTEDHTAELEQLMSSEGTDSIEDSTLTNIYQKKFVVWLRSIDDDLKVLWYVLYFLQKSPKHARTYLDLSPNDYANLRKRLSESFADFVIALRTAELDTETERVVQ